MTNHRITDTCSKPLKIVTKKEDSSPKDSEMAENMTGEQLMKFMTNFKNTIEKSMGDIGKELTDKIDAKLTNLDKGLDTLTNEVKKNETDKRSNTET